MKKLTVSPTSKAILIPVRQRGTVTNLVTYCQSHPNGLHLTQQDYLEACGRGLSDFLISKDVIAEDIVEAATSTQTKQEPEIKVIPPKPASVISSDTLVIEEPEEKNVKKTRRSKKK